MKKLTNVLIALTLLAWQPHFYGMEEVWKYFGGGSGEKQGEKEKPQFGTEIPKTEIINIPSELYDFAQDAFKYIKVGKGMMPTYWLKIPSLNDSVLIYLTQPGREKRPIKIEVAGTFLREEGFGFYNNGLGNYFWKSNTSRYNIDPLKTLVNDLQSSQKIPTKVVLQQKTQQLYQPSLPFSYVLASCNILDESFYTKWAKNVKLMLPKQRQQYFLGEFQQGGVFTDADIICLQEWTLGNSQLINTLGSLGYAIVEPLAKQKGTVATCILYKTNKFSLIKGSEKQFTLGNKLCIEAQLQPNFKNAPVITVDSVHVQWDASEQTELGYIANIPGLQSQNLCVICGDFNYNTYGYKASQQFGYRYTTKQNTNIKIGLDIKDYFKLKNVIGKSFADATANLKDGQGRDLVFSPTAYDDGFTKMDYMFYTPTDANQQNSLTCTQFVIYPQDLKKLIKHTQPQKQDGPESADYFSDHAVLKGYFTIK